MRFSAVSNLLLILNIILVGATTALASETSKRFLERVQILEVGKAGDEVTIVDPQGKARTLKKGDRVHEESAIVKEITRSTLVFTRYIEGAGGAAGESLVVVRFDGSGRVTKVREYSTVSDVALPSRPPREPQR